MHMMARKFSLISYASDEMYDVVRGCDAHYLKYTLHENTLYFESIIIIHLDAVSCVVTSNIESNIHTESNELKRNKFVSENSNLCNR